MANDSLTTPHNQAIVGDSLTSLIINYQWRRLIADMIYPATHREFWTGNDTDIDAAVDNAISLIIDLYNNESALMPVPRIRTMLIGDASIAASTWTKLDFAYPVEDYLTYSQGSLFVDSVKRNLLVDASASGLYRIRASVRVFSAASGNRVSARLSQSSIGVISYFVKDVLTSDVLFMDCIARVSATDSFKIEVFGTLAFTVLNSTTNAPYTTIEAHRLGDL